MFSSLDLVWFLFLLPFSFLSLLFKTELREYVKHRLWPNSCPNANKCTINKQITRAHMSQLPEDVLVSFISNLSLKEAGATSVLSRQWLHLWECPSQLYFDGWKELAALNEKRIFLPSNKICRLRKMERHKYVKWVNQVLRFCKSSMLEGFKIRFDLDNSYSREIDSWLQYAFARKVQSLEVNLLKYDKIPRSSEKMYTFRSQILSPSNNFMKPYPNEGLHHIDYLANFNSLKDLSFTCVNVSDEVLQFFLSNCPHLERLEVGNSLPLENIEVSGSSLMLKHLKIRHCPNLKSIKVCNTNLVSLEVLGTDALIHIENLPLLGEVSLGFITNIDDIFTTLSSCLAELKVLILHIGYFPQLKNTELCGYPSLPKLKRLEIIGFANESESLMGYASLIHAAPYLSEFVLQLLWSECSRMLIKSKTAPTSPDRYLKMVKVAGYCGRATDLEVVMFFLKNAVGLEELIIDTNNQYSAGRGFLFDAEIEEKQEAIIRAKMQLEGKVPSRVKLLIV